MWEVKWFAPGHPDHNVGGQIGRGKTNDWPTGLWIITWEVKWDAGD